MAHTRVVAQIHLLARIIFVRRTNHWHSPITIPPKSPVRAPTRNMTEESSLPASFNIPEKTNASNIMGQTRTRPTSVTRFQIAHNSSARRKDLESFIIVPSACLSG